MKVKRARELKKTRHASVKWAARLDQRSVEVTYQALDITVTLFGYVVATLTGTGEGMLLFYHSGIIGAGRQVRWGNDMRPIYYSSRKTVRELSTGEEVLLTIKGDLVNTLPKVITKIPTFDPVSKDQDHLTRVKKFLKTRRKEQILDAQILHVYVEQ